MTVIVFSLPYHCHPRECCCMMVIVFSRSITVIPGVSLLYRRDVLFPLREYHTAPLPQTGMLLVAINGTCNSSSLGEDNLRSQYPRLCPCNCTECGRYRRLPPQSVCYDNATSFAVSTSVTCVACSVISFTYPSSLPLLSPTHPHTHTYTHSKQPMLQSSVNRHVFNVPMFVLPWQH